MYYEHPDEPAAYDVPNQFMFGTELLVAPITSPADRQTGLGRVKAWLPEGTWVDMFTGRRYRGDRTLYLHRDLDSIPVLARAGAIVPMVPAEEIGRGTDPTSRIELRVFAGSDGEFTLIEDRDDQRWVRTRITYDDSSGQVTVHEVQGEASTVPDDRTYETVIIGGPGDIGPDAQDAVFRILDQAQMGFDLKRAAFDAVQASTSAADTVMALQALDVTPSLLGSRRRAPPAE